MWCKWQIVQILEEQRLIQFLMGLSGSYTAIRGSILMKTPFPSMSQVYSLLVQEERQRQVKSEPQFLGDNASFTTGTTNPATVQRRSDNRRSNLFCEHCKKSDHTMDRCYKIHGYPTKHRIEGVEAISMHPTEKHTIPGQNNLHKMHSLLRQKCRHQICQG